MYKFLQFTIAFILCQSTAFGQMGIGNEWNPRSPVSHPLRLSGTFGELRTNHFHAGIDIKKSGNQYRDAVYAVDKGYVSRISIRGAGYGNCLYIDHGNGYTSVYAHLHSLHPDIADYIKKMQYQKERFEIELYPPDTMFIFDIGDQIGEMGNTGSSHGAHLHFEIRETGTQTPVNPLHFDFKLNDKIAPQPKAIYIHYLDSEHNVFKRKKIPVKKGLNDIYEPVSGDTINIGAWRVGLAVEVRDKMNSTPNNNGIYQLSMEVDSTLTHSFNMNRIPFSISKYINAHIDFPYKTESRKSIHRCYLLPGNKLTIYDHVENDGIVKLYEKKARKVELEVGDFFQNKSRISFHMLRDVEMEIPSKEDHDYLLPFDEPSIIELEDGLLTIPQEAIYSNLKMKYFSSVDSSEGYYSPIHHLHNDKIPIHRKMTIKLLGDQVPDTLRKKAFIASCENGSLVNAGGVWEGSFLVTDLSKFGDYTIATDLVPPVIKVVNFNKNASGRKHFTFTISDNYGSRGDAKGLSYEARIDGRWVLMEYDAKSRRIRHYFEDDLEKGSHTFELLVKDSVGNETTFKRSFNY